MPLDYRIDLQEHYQNLSHLPGFALLESADKKRGRYDVLTAYPYDSVKIHRDSNNKFSELLRLDSLLHAQSSLIDLPFQGGAIGYVSYDLGAELFDIFSQPQSSLSSLPLLDLGFYDWGIIVDHLLRKITLFGANTQASTPDIIRQVSSLWNQKNVLSHPFKAKAEFKPLISKSDYQVAFNEIHSALYQGRSYQVNYTQPFHASYTGDAWQMYRKVCAKNPVPFSAFMRTDDADILSFSPERFILYDQGSILTSPIKGTIGRSADPDIDEQLKKDLEASSKNHAENVMIVDLLRNDFGKIAKPKSVQVVDLCALQSFASVHHLVSTISAECRSEISPFQAFMSCFPGGSITGAPKLESMKIINEQELYSRGVYCGGIGYFSNHGRFDFNIAIRTITAKEEVLHLAAGGGIVIDSDCDDEYRECFTKIEAIINGLK